MRLVTVAPNPSIDRLYELDRLVHGAINRPLTETARRRRQGLNVARAAIALGADVRSPSHCWPATPAGGWPTRLAAERILGRWAWTDWRDAHLPRDPRRPRTAPHRAERGRTARRPGDVGRSRDCLLGRAAGGDVGRRHDLGQPASRRPGRWARRARVRATRSAASGRRSTPAVSRSGGRSRSGRGSSSSTSPRRRRRSATRHSQPTRHRTTRWRLVAARGSPHGPAARSWSPGAGRRDRARPGRSALRVEPSTVPAAELPGRQWRRLPRRACPRDARWRFVRRRAPARCRRRRSQRAQVRGAGRLDPSDAAHDRRPGSGSSRSRAESVGRALGRRRGVADRRTPSVRPIASHEHWFAAQIDRLDAVEEVRLDPAQVGSARLAQASVTRAPSGRPRRHGRRTSSGCAPRARRPRAGRSGG